MIVSAVTGFLVLLGLAALGLVLVRVVLGRLDWLSLAGLCVPVGGGVFAWVLFIFSWAGLPLTRLSAALIWVVLMGALLGLLRAGMPRLPLPAPTTDPAAGRLDPWARRLAWTVFGLLIALAMFLSVAHAYGSWDAAAGWAAKGYGIAKEGSIFAGEDWGAWGLTYPLNLSLQIAQFQLFGDDLVPMSKLIFPFYLFSLGIGAHRFWHKQGTNAILSGLGVVFLISVPLVFVHATQGYANLPLTAYVVQAVLWGIEGLQTGDRRAMLMSGLLFGLAGWTRAEAFGYCLVLILGLLGSFWLSGTRDFNLRWWLIPAAVITGAWLLFGWHGVTSDRLGGTALRNAWLAWQGGDFHWRQLYLIPRLMYDRMRILSRWGVLFQVVALLVVLRIYTVRPKAEPAIFAASVATALTALVPIGLFYLQSYALGSTFVQVLNESFDRAFFPAAALMLITAVRMHAGASPVPIRASRTYFPADAPSH